MFLLLRRRKNRASREFRAVAAVQRAVAVYCSDPRFQGAFSDYLDSVKLGRGQYCPLVLAGGPSPLIHSKFNESEFDTVARRIRLHCRHSPDIRSLILFGHEHCLFVDEIPEGKLTFGRAINRDRQQRHDLHYVVDSVQKGVESKLLTLLTELDLELQARFARFVDQSRTRIAFEDISA